MYRRERLPQQCHHFSHLQRCYNLHQPVEVLSISSFETKSPSNQTISPNNTVPWREHPTCQLQQYDKSSSAILIACVHSPSSLFWTTVALMRRYINLLHLCVVCRLHTGSKRSFNERVERICEATDLIRVGNCRDVRTIINIPFFWEILQRMNHLLGRFGMKRWSGYPHHCCLQLPFKRI